MYGVAIADLVARRFAQAKDEGNSSPATSLVFIARDGARMQSMATILRQTLPSHPVLTFPAWDCLPYDRVSPGTITIVSRMHTLAQLASGKSKGAIIVTTANAIVQKVLPREIVKEMSFHASAGKQVDSAALIEWATINGYMRVPTVRETGEFAVRGGLIDLFPAGRAAPLRFDFFGSTLETIRKFNPENQRTTGPIKRISLVPMSEIIITPKTIKNFRQSYTSAFGGHTVNDPLYGAISAGQRFPGAEHWLPFFYDEMNTLADYCGDAPLVFDRQCLDAIKERRLQIKDYHRARIKVQETEEQGSKSQTPLNTGAKYNPIDPDLLYDLKTPPYEFGHQSVQISTFDASAISTSESTSSSTANIDYGGRLPPGFAAERQSVDINLFEAVVARLTKAKTEKKRTIIACWSEGTRERMRQVLVDNGLHSHKLAQNWLEAQNTAIGTVSLVVLGIESGFETSEMLVLCEQDILGERAVRGLSKRRSKNALREASSLAAGDFVVHLDHGIARFLGLKPIEVAGAPHDCVELEYAKGDKLYLPVENIELLTRYGEAGSQAQLDRLGGVAWQAKKAQLKDRIRIMAGQLIKIAANRAMSKAEPVEIPPGAYDEFVARFQFEETEDQLTAIEAIMEDITSGKVMDRLVCGDVGFGKTEVALRAAFVIALSGRQVAIVVPTTLLARQHYRTFVERFAGLPIKIAQASRLVSSSEMKSAKQGISDGSVDIVIGTHALLAKSISFYDLGLLVIDEEQHFGVGHKERLKEIKHSIHVLTLSATPIPRTLQMALTGVRDLSLLATAPVDRLAIRTFISPFDALSVREALLREKYRGGQSFYVVPRIKDQGRIAEFLREQVPEVSFVIANGQMPAGELDEIMNEFYDGKFDVLLSTTIVESGLDIPNANTLIVHRAEMFGLAQLYQIRGRIGRSKIRAYALFTTAPNQRLGDQAQRRLQVLQSLDTLGAGFQLASHDMDIRGAGNLLGDEQSGHIREVGYELYQAMLEEAVADLRAGSAEALSDGQSSSQNWSPQISVGMPVMIPEKYVPDLQVRMQLYRRLGDLNEREEIDAFGAEMIDRFGPLPDSVQSLLKIILVKSFCRKANIEKVDAGPKGAVITLRNNSFPNPAGLVKLIGDPASGVRLKPDHRLVFSRNWSTPQDRLNGVAQMTLRMARLSENSNT
ncbi:MAG: transcription-repair coupling factor [Devosiaceae bacterium]|nr:transcription-repair coupling factor [Devosiaceae bacterium]